MNLKKSQPAPDEAFGEVESGSSSSKLLLVGGGVVAVAAAGALAFVLLSGGDDVAETPAAAAPKPVAAATPSATETATPSTSASIPTYAAKNARDPFKALSAEASTGSSKVGTSAPTSAPSSSDSTSVPTWTPPETTATYTATPTSKPSTPTSKPSSTSSPTADEPDLPYDVNLVVLSKIVDDSSVEVIVDATKVIFTLDAPANGPFVLKSIDTDLNKATFQYGEVNIDLPLHQVVILQQS